MTQKLTYLSQRSLSAILVIAAVVVASFFLLRLPAGDVVDVIAGEAGASDPEFLASLRQRFGLDRPLAEQFLTYVQGLVHFDLGYSYRLQRPVLDVIVERLPATLMLASAVLVIGVALGVLLGAIAAVKVDRWQDTVVSSLSLLAYATPNFWLGLMFVLLFAVNLRWFPPFGMVSMGTTQTGFALTADVLWHLTLPALALGLHYTAIFARITRAAMLEVTDLDHVATAHAKGLRPGQIVRRHVLRNALLPIVTYVGLQAGTLVGGSVLIETVFAWPGVGRLAFDAIVGRDHILLLGIFIVLSVMVVAFNFITDLIYLLIDPRIDLR